MVFKGDYTIDQTIEEVFDLVVELGGEPHMNIDSFTARTICHGGNSRKLYYYNNKII